MSSISTPLSRKSSHSTPKIKENMDELVHFVKKLEEQDEENKMPNIPRSTPKGNNVGKHNNGGGAKTDKVATESPRVIVNINPSDYLERINRRKIVFAKTYKHNKY